MAAIRPYTSFQYQAGRWAKPRRVVAKVEFHPGELFPRVSFIVTNRSLPYERVLAFYNDRGTVEQHIEDGKHALKWTRLSCMRFTANAVRLQLHALAYTGARHSPRAAGKKAWRTAFSGPSLAEGTPNGEIDNRSNVADWPNPTGLNSSADHP